MKVTFVSHGFGMSEEVRRAPEQMLIDVPSIPPGDGQVVFDAAGRVVGLRVDASKPSGPIELRIVPLSLSLSLRPSAKAK